MAEVAGLAIGGVALASLFDTCMRTFERIDAGKNCGRDCGKIRMVEQPCACPQLAVNVIWWRVLVCMAFGSRKATFSFWLCPDEAFPQSSIHSSALKEIHAPICEHREGKEQNDLLRDDT